MHQSLGVDQYFNPLLLNKLIKFPLFIGIVERVGEAVAASRFDAEPQIWPLPEAEELADSGRRGVRQSEGLPADGPVGRSPQHGGRHG